MQIEYAPTTLSSLDTKWVETLCVPLFMERTQPSGAAGLADWRLLGRIGKWILDGVFRGELGETLLTVRPSRDGPRRAFLFGLGPYNKAEPHTCLHEVGLLVRALQDAGTRELVLLAPSKPHQPRPIETRSTSQPPAPRISSIPKAARASVQPTQVDNRLDLERFEHWIKSDAWKASNIARVVALGSEVQGARHDVA